jgi:hypothetical protein
MLKLATLFGLIILTVPAFAQKVSPRTCRILFLEAPASAPQKLFLFDGVSSQEVDLPRMNFSQVYDIAAGNTRLLLLPAPVTKPEEIPAGAPEVTIPESIGDCYLIVSSNPANKIAPVSIQVVNASANQFKNGQMFWFNLTQNNIGGQIGSQALRLAPSSRKIIDAPALSATSYVAKIGYVISGETNIQPICETQWQHNPDSRMVVFVFNQNHNATPRVMGFSDFRIEDKK